MYQKSMGDARYTEEFTNTLQNRSWRVSLYMGGEDLFFLGSPS